MQTCLFLDLDFTERSEILNSIPPEEQIMWLWCIVLCFAIPEAIGLLDALTICIFKTYKFPDIKSLCIVLSIELLSTVGLSIFVLIILPSFDILKGATMTSCVCLLPAVLGTPWGLIIFCIRTESIYLASESIGSSILQPKIAANVREQESDAQTPGKNTFQLRQSISRIAKQFHKNKTIGSAVVRNQFVLIFSTEKLHIYKTSNLFRPNHFFSFEKLKHF